MIGEETANQIMAKIKSDKTAIILDGHNNIIAGLMGVIELQQREIEVLGLRIDKIEKVIGVLIS